MKLHVKSASFSADNGQTSRLSIFYCVSSHKNFIPKYLLQISLKLHEHRGRYWRKKLPWTILEEQFPVPRYTAASKLDNSVISLLWQLRCRCNPDHNNFHLYLIQLWWQFFEIFVPGDGVYAPTFEVLTLKNCIEPS